MMPQARSQAPLGYRADIDGLRAIAVTAVVLFHARLFPFSSGYVGVDIFFVISGYLIGGIILRDITARRFSFAMFYARRARRILPALFTVVLTSCLAGWFLLSPSQFRDVGATATSALLGVSNISYFKFKDYFAPEAGLSPLLMTWSLGVEEQFYLFFPCLMLGIGRWAAKQTLAVLALITLVSFLASAWCTYASPAAAFYLLPFRAWELGVGVIVAFIESVRGGGGRWYLLSGSGLLQQVMGFGGLALLGCSIFAFDQSTPFPGFVAVLPVLGTAALIGARSSWINRNVLSWRPVVFVGTLSYSWYLWHWPLMSYVRNVAFDEPTRPVMILAAAFAFCLAVVSWRFVERPFRHGPVRVRPVLLGYGAVLTVALIFPLAIKWGQGFPMHVSFETRRIDALHQQWMSATRSCLADWDSDKPNLSPACVAKRPGRPTIVVIGDSHANSLAAGIRALAAEQDWGYEILAKAACQPLIGVADWRHEQPQLAPSCAAFMAVAFARALSDPSAATVILAGAWPRSDEDPSPVAEHFVATPPYTGSTTRLSQFHRGLERAVDGLAGAGKHVIIIGDVPQWRFNVLQVALSRVIPLRASLGRLFWSRAPGSFPERPGLDLVYGPNDENTRFFHTLSEGGLATYLDLFPRFCHDGTCVFERDGELLFMDKDHLSLFGSHYALQDFYLGTPIDPSCISMFCHDESFGQSSKIASLWPDADEPIERELPLPFQTKGIAPAWIVNSDPDH
jgi:peptidoglycan/LPS O-acetylase OafA/YrhL